MAPSSCSYNRKEVYDRLWTAAFTGKKPRLEGNSSCCVIISIWNRQYVSSFVNSKTTDQRNCHARGLKGREVAVEMSKWQHQPAPSPLSRAQNRVHQSPTPASAHPHSAKRLAKSRRLPARLPAPSGRAPPRKAPPEPEPKAGGPPARARAPPYPVPARLAVEGSHPGPLPLLPQRPQGEKRGEQRPRPGLLRRRRPAPPRRPQGRAPAVLDEPGRHGEQRGGEQQHQRGPARVRPHGAARSDSRRPGGHGGLRRRPSRCPGLAGSRPQAPVPGPG